MKPSEIAGMLAGNYAQPAIDRVVYYLEGAPGLGKSDIVKQVCRKLGIHLLDIRLAQYEPVDLRGVPEVVNGRTHFALPDFWPAKDWQGVIFFDEFSQCDRSLQAVSLQILRDRRLGDWDVPDGAMLLAAGNRTIDRTGSHKMGSANRDRVVRLPFDLDNDEWQKWALTNGINADIRAFLMLRPTLLSTWDPKIDADVFATPRSYEMVSKQMKWCPAGSVTEMLTGTLGVDVTLELTAFLELRKEMPNPEAFIKDPDNQPIPKDKPGLLFALCTSLPEFARDPKPAVFDAIAKVITRLPDEFAVLLLRDTSAVDSKIVDNKFLKAWWTDHKDLMIGQN